MPIRKNPLLKLTKRFRKDEDGVAAIEFAIIAPIMITMYFGLSEMATAIAVDRRISHGANVAADLLTQQAQMSPIDIEETLAASVRVMGVANVGDITMQIQSYVLDSNDQMVSEGLINFNTGASNLPAFDASTLSARVLSQTSGVVVTRVAYTYSPLQLRYFDSDITLSETFLLKPRRSNAVVFAEAQGKVATCTGTSFGDVTCS